MSQHTQNWTGTATLLEQLSASEPATVATQANPTTGSTAARTSSAPLQSESDPPCCGRKIEGCCPFNPLSLDLNTFLGPSEDGEAGSGIRSGPLSAIARRRHLLPLGPQKGGRSIPGADPLRWKLTLSHESYHQDQRFSHLHDDYDVESKLTKDIRELVASRAVYLSTALHVLSTAPANAATESSEDLEDPMVRENPPIPGHRIVLFPYKGQYGRTRGPVILSPLSAVAADATEFSCWSAHHLPASSHQAKELKRHFDTLAQSSASTS